MTGIRIENVVASTSLGDQLDLQSIALAIDGAEYDPEQFPGLIYRLRDPKTAILLFRSGKVVCTGGKSMKQVIDSISKISKIIRAGGQKVFAHPRIEVQNIVATADLGGEINLTTVAVTLGLARVEYEPEQFPGLVCRMEEPHVVLLLFGSGKLVCTGARRPSDIGLAVEKITKELQDAGLLGRPFSGSPEPPNRPSKNPRPGAAASRAAKPAPSVGAPSSGLAA